MISNCGYDENGKYTGGQPGDQTGDEWAVIGWYNRPWNVVLRHPDTNVGSMIATLARAAAKNDKVGYCQSHRGSFWTQLQKAGYDPSKITTACEADCSSGVAAIVKAVGYKKGLTALQNVSKDAYTGNLRSVLKQAGFEVLTDAKYLQSDRYLLPGDVLLYEGHHTAINLDRGSAVASTAVTPGWKQDATGWKYQCADGSFHKSTWKAINGHWYYFKDDGYIATDWYKIGSEWYYFQPSGDLQGACYHESDKRNGSLEIWNI